MHFGDLFRDALQTDRLVHLPLWQALSPSGLQAQLRQFPELKQRWAKLEALRKSQGSKLSVEASFVPSLLADFLDTVEHPTPGVPGTHSNGGEGKGKDEGEEEEEEEEDEQSGEVTASKPALYDRPTTLYLERLLELLIDLLAQLNTRRFLLPLIMDLHLVVRCRLSPLFRALEGKLFCQLLDQVRFYERYEIDDKTGLPLTEADVIANHYDSITRLQKIAFKYFSTELRKLALSSVSAIDSRHNLAEHLAPISLQQLCTLCDKLKLPLPLNESFRSSRAFVLEIITTALERRKSQKQQINSLPLYPDESVLWDENLVPSMHYSGETCLALPKLNLQFLTFNDYLLRNFHLFRNESTYEIREDIAHVVTRLRPKLANNGIGRSPPFLIRCSAQMHSRVYCSLPSSIFCSLSPFSFSVCCRVDYAALLEYFAAWNMRAHIRSTVLLMHVDRTVRSW